MLTVYEKRGSFSPIAILLVGHTVVKVHSNNLMVTAIRKRAFRIICYVMMVRFLIELCVMSWWNDL